MKEGYIQLKITEINDKCKQIEQMISMEKKRIELMEQRVGGFKDLIKKLQDLDNFKKNMLKEIKKDNQELLEKEIKNISKKIADEIDILVKSKIKEIEKTMKYIISREKELDQQNEMILQINKNVNYLLNHNNLLMMKLVNKAIISDREVNELHTRSSKKSD